MRVNHKKGISCLHADYLELDKRNDASDQISPDEHSVHANCTLLLEGECDLERVLNCQRGRVNESSDLNQRHPDCCLGIQTKSSFTDSQGSEGEEHAHHKHEGAWIGWVARKCLRLGRDDRANCEVRECEAQVHVGNCTGVTIWVDYTKHNRECVEE